MKNHRRAAEVLAVALTAALVLVGCGSSAGTASSGSAAESVSEDAAWSPGSSASEAASSEASSEESASADAAETGESAGTSGGTVTNLSQIDMSSWLYNSDDNVWYQLNIQYAENSPDENYDSLAVFVPGEYFDGTENSDDTWTCTLNTSNEVSGYTAETAPIVIPVNTPGYSAQEELTSYTDVSEYTDAGFVYVHIGARGRDAGAPYGVTDFKAGIRYIRYNEGVIAGSMDRIISFGMSGGGAQSAVIGATGDSSLYDAYLEETGAVQGVSDAVAGSMCWCPITSLDSADAAYEWNMGTTRTGLSDEEQKISDALASSYMEYINSIGLTDEEGNVLTLEGSDSDGIDQAGTYYEYIKSVVEMSLANFISDTEWPYDASSAGSENGGRGSAGGGDFTGGGGRGGFGGPDGTMSGEMPSDNIMSGMPEGDLPSDGASSDAAAGNPADSTAESAGTTADTMNDSEANDDITRNETTSSLDLSGTYETAEDYIDALNADGEWVSYDASTGEVTITSVADFVSRLKTASKNLGAFDQLDDGQGENTLFGYGDGNGAHFDSTLAAILEDLGNEYADDYAENLTRTDSVGNTVDVRLRMYSPLGYLLESGADYGDSAPAKYWRIRTGIEQSDTALSTEVNLALALNANEHVESVDFATVWGMGHTMAERTGDSTTNFISWVNDCFAA